MSFLRNGRYFFAANKAFNRCGLSIVKNCSTNVAKIDHSNVNCSTNVAKIDHSEVSKESFRFPRPEPDVAFLLSPQNRSTIVNNLVARLEIQHDEAEEKLNELSNLNEENKNSEANHEKILKFAEKFPNSTHPDVIELREPRTLIAAKAWVPKTPTVRSFETLARIVAGARWENNAQVSTDRSYYLTGQLAEMEQALVRYAVDFLVDEHDFKLVSVPDLLHPNILRGCGMDVDGERTQVYQLDFSLHPPTALSGTAEMAIGGLFLNKAINFSESRTVDHPIKPVEKLVAVSRCYRAESSRGQAERGIYRVHHFTKVEMFALTPPDIEISNKVHGEFLEIQKTLFNNLDLTFHVLDMPPNDLGSPAYRKFDIEALLPGRRSTEDGTFDATCFGEISSTSNCTDYQSRRLNIRTTDGKFVHTVNGTACAVPRMIMAICEQFQTENGCVAIPSKLQKYLPPRGDKKAPGLIEPKPRKTRPTLRYIRGPKYFEAKFKEQLAAEGKKTTAKDLK